MALPGGASPATNLPAALTSFIGRERELAEVRQLLLRTRLLTLWGPGGCGKTRLAFEVANGALGQFLDGVWLARLEALTDPGLVPGTVAAALGVGEEPGRPLAETLVCQLRPRKLLIVLDTCEHVMDACTALIEALLSACADLQILATSRQLLGIAGEMVWQVPPLSLPDSQRPADLEAVCQAESVRLFVERAAAYNPSFALTEQIAGAVTQVCQRLDGLPLAIELAARVVALPVQQLAPRLDERFRLLVGGSRTADPRHQTLRAAVDWSYELLTGAERVFFQRLSVFVDGFELEAVEAVCINDGVEPEDLLGLLLQLVDKSLVNAHSQGGNARYRLLETLREYGWEQLAASGQARAVQARHAAYYLVFAEQVASQLDGPAFAVWLDRLEQDHGNLRAALRWFGDRREVEASLRLSLALWRFWGARGHLSEGRGWFQASLAESDGAPPAVQAEALEAAGTLAWYQGDRAAAASLLEASLALRRESGDTERTAGVLNALGAVRRQQGEYLKAESLFEEALAIFRELGNQPGMATTLNKIGLLASDQQDYARAVDVHWRALSLQRAPDSRPGLAESLDGLARATAGRRHYLQAARLYGAASAMCEPDAGLVSLVDRVAREQSLATVRARLGEHAFARARENGRAMPLADAVAYARTTLAQLPEALHSSAPTSPDAHPAERAAAPQSPAELGSIRLPALAFGHPALTARERDVTRLIAGGLSNREIAEELVVSVRTVERHITNLYAKLGARGKAAAIAYALRHGLVRN